MQVYEIFRFPSHHHSLRSLPYATMIRIWRRSGRGNMSNRALYPHLFSHFWTCILILFQTSGAIQIVESLWNLCNISPCSQCEGERLARVRLETRRTCLPRKFRHFLMIYLRGVFFTMLEVAVENYGVSRKKCSCPVDPHV